MLNQTMEWIKKLNSKTPHTLGKRTRRSAATSGLVTAPTAWLPASRTTSGGRKVNASFSSSSPRSLTKPRAASGVACCCGTLLMSSATASAAWAAARRAAALGRASSTSLESLWSMEYSAAAAMVATVLAGGGKASAVVGLGFSHASNEEEHHTFP